MTITNTIVANAIKARTARNSVEVEISPGYAARVQHAMRDAARAVSGVRMTSTNTLECRDEDAADDVVDILKQAGLPDGEVWTNAKRVARNERLVPFDKAKVKPGDSVWFKGREFVYMGSHGSLLVELEDVFDGEAEFVSPYDRNLKMAANAAYNLSSTEAKVGDMVRVVGALGTYVVTKVDGEWIEIKDADDGTPQGRVKARFATPVKNAKRTARNAGGDINADLGRDVNRLAAYITEDLKKQAESYAYWIEADCGRQVNSLLGVAEKNKDVQPSIVAELKRLRKRVDDAIAASKRLPR